MKIHFHPHALERMEERGTNKEEITLTVKDGERFPAKFERTGFRRNFSYNRKWHNKHYEIKQVEVYAVQEANNWIIITVITRYF